MKAILKAMLAATVLYAAIANAAPLSNQRQALEFTGIEKWLNTEPLTMQQLRGKVVLVDFWTYTCINCIRTLPYVKSWHQKYKDQGLVVVGVHTPEFPFERSTDNVKTAIKRSDIRFPVAQDNRYATWSAYDNQYWPAFYLIDKKGQVVYTHFGEGQYAQTEAAIKALLEQKE
jgi:thiol-disulfide isomerase/thioredoxin